VKVEKYTVQVKYYATLRDVAGVKSEAFELPAEASFQDLETILVAAHPGFIGVMVDGNGEIFHHIHFFINDQSVVISENDPEIQLKDGDTISIFPAVEGGL